MSAQGEFLADLVDAADDLGLMVAAVSPSSIELEWGHGVRVTIASRLLTGRLLRTVLHPSPDPAYAEPKNSSPAELRA
ncbi:MAG: hypothetical protein ABIV25_04685 [Paracoccaceae bacterium]